jgi:hypothetical protein
VYECNFDIHFENESFILKIICILRHLFAEFTIHRRRSVWNSGGVQIPLPFPSSLFSSFLPFPLALSCLPPLPPSLPLCSLPFLPFLLFPSHPFPFNLSLPTLLYTYPIPFPLLPTVMSVLTLPFPSLPSLPSPPSLP